jgi:hypothetical protein
MTRNGISFEQKQAERMRDLERDARKALELRAGRTFGDWEWAQMKGKLTEFYAILRGWEAEEVKHAG